MCQTPNFTGDTKKLSNFHAINVKQKTAKRFEVWLGFIEPGNEHSEKSIRLRGNLCQRNDVSQKISILIHKKLRNFFIFEFKKKARKYFRVITYLCPMIFSLTQSNIQKSNWTKIFYTDIS